MIVFSPVRAEPEILKETIPDWFAMNGVDEVWVYDDNVNPESTELLKQMKCKFLDPIDLPKSQYAVTEKCHHWADGAVSRVTAIKNYALKTFKNDWTRSTVLFMDADICPHPAMLDSMQAAMDEVRGKGNRAIEEHNLFNIVSEVFWTKWAPNQPYLPNVWDQHPYQFHSYESITSLADGGIHQVGGLGACTLMHVPMFTGFNFSPINGLPEWWEDRQFCVRASALGYNLWADTKYPPFHVYRPSMLEECRQWKKAGRSREWFLKHWLNDEWRKQIAG